MTVPLPNWRSICVRAPARAVSRALLGSWLLMPITLRRVPDRTQTANRTDLRRISVVYAPDRTGAGGWRSVSSWVAWGCTTRRAGVPGARDRRGEARWVAG